MLLLLQLLLVLLLVLLLLLLCCCAVVAVAAAVLLLALCRAMRAMPCHAMPCHACHACGLGVWFGSVAWECGFGVWECWAKLGVQSHSQDACPKLWLSPPRRK